MSAKTCFKCGESKDISEFYAHSRMADGHLNKCKECAKRDALANRAANAEYYRAYDRVRAKMPHRAESSSKISKAWIQANPKRRSAQNAVNNAIRDGRLQKLPCFVCGDKAEAHHPDYDRPLDVVWLCPAHHKQAHAMVRKVA